MRVPTDVAHSTSITAPFAMHDPAILEPGFRRPLQDAIRAANPRDNQAKVRQDGCDAPCIVHNIPNRKK